MSEDDKCNIVENDVDEFFNRFIDNDSFMASQIKKVGWDDVNDFMSDNRSLIIDAIVRELS